MLRQDLWFAFQVLSKHRRYAALSVVTIALATGAAIAIASIAYAALLRPLPFPASNRLAMLYITASEPGRAVYNQRWSFGRFQLLRRMQTSFVEVASFGPQSLNMQGADQSERITGESVSAPYFRTLGVSPLIGRTFAADEDSIPGARPVAVLGYDLWRRRFGGDSAVVGRAVRVEGLELTVIGIMPPGFGGLTGRAELWTTKAMAPLLSYREHLTTNQNFISVVARLRPPATFETARAEMDVLGRRIQAALPSDRDEPTTFAATAVPVGQARVDPANREVVLILLAAAALLLLIAAANLASLQLGRAIDRRREIAVRLALGATRGRLVQQLLTESTILGLIGTLGGLGLSSALSAWLVAPGRTIGVRGYYGQIAEFATTRLDGRVVLFALVLAIGLPLLFGLVPALRATKLDLTVDLRGRQAGGSRSRLALQSALVVTEVALALILSIGASLLVKSLVWIQHVDRGFEAANLLTFRIQPSDVRYPAPVAPAVIEQVLARVSAVPGVVSASVDAAAPFEGPANSTLYIVGRPEPSPGRAPEITRHYVGPDHFKTLG
ncbi:MAG: ABC transporter permease, partial [Gemmatimonadota bacterium]